MKVKVKMTGEVIEVVPTDNRDVFGRQIYIDANGNSYISDELLKIIDVEPDKREMIMIPRRRLVELAQQTKKLLDIIDNELHTTGE